MVDADDDVAANLTQGSSRGTPVSGRMQVGRRSLALRVVTSRAREQGGRKARSTSFLGVREEAQRGGGDGRQRPTGRRQGRL